MKEAVANTIVPTGELGEQMRIPLDYEKTFFFALGKCSDTATVSLLFPFLSADENFFFCTIVQFATLYVSITVYC